jgi:hypothetical protein
MALMNLSAVVGYAITETLAGQFDFVTLFYIAGLLETIVIFALFFIDTEETQRVLGGDDAGGGMDGRSGNDRGRDKKSRTDKSGRLAGKNRKNQPIQAELIEG